jgi:hypothetical protein
MASKRPFANPFYLLLLLVGVAFLLTATSYGVMAFRDVGGASPAAPGSSLMSFLDRHGAWLLVGELALLVLASLAAMATESYWTSKAPEKQPSVDGEESTPDP